MEKKAKNLKDAKEKLSQILGMDVRGYKVHKVLAEEMDDVRNELYLSISLDRSMKMPCIIASGSGGMDIEAVPDRQIFKEWVNPLIGIQSFNIRAITTKLGLNREQTKGFSSVLNKVYQIL